MSDSASVEKSMDTENKSVESGGVLEEESWRRLAMGGMAHTDLPPRDESGDCAREGTATTMDEPVSRPTVIRVKEALPDDTLPFVNHGVADVKIPISTRALEERPINRALPPASHHRRFMGEKSKSSSAVDNLVEVPHSRRIADGENKQRFPGKMDDDKESSEATGTGQTLFHERGQLQKNLIRILHEMDERTDYFSDSDDSCDMTSESSDSDDTLSYQSTDSQQWSSRSTHQRPHAQSPDFGNSRRSKTPDSTISARSSRSTSQSQHDQSEDFRYSSRSQTPVSTISTLSSRSSNSQLQPKSPTSRNFSRSQTPDTTRESVSHRTSSASRNLGNNSPSHIAKARDLQASLKEEPDCRQSRSSIPVSGAINRAASSDSRETRIVPSASFTGLKKNQHNPSADKEMMPGAGYSSDDSDCIIGPFPLFGSGPHTETLTKEASLRTCSIGSNPSVMESNADVRQGEDSSEDSDCIVGPFPLFASVPSEEAFERKASPARISIGSDTNPSLVQCHDDLEPETYSSDDSDCIVGPFPLFGPRRPKEPSEGTPSPQSTNIEDLPSLSAGSPGYSSDDSDCIVGAFPLFAPAAPKEQCLSQSYSSLSECASEEFCDPKSAAHTTSATCWKEDSNDTRKDEVKRKGRLRRCIGCLRKGLRSLSRSLSNLATTCFPVAKR